MSNLPLNKYVSDFIQNLKQLLKNTFRVEDKANHNDWLQEDSPISSDKISKEDSTYLVVQRRKDDSKYHKFKLFSGTMGGKPFFYYDSSGRAHYNNVASVPLEDRLVETPHFNTIDENNIPIAYKTEELTTVKKEQLDDIQFTCNHFCDHTRIKTKENGYPKILLPLKLIS